MAKVEFGAVATDEVGSVRIVGVRPVATKHDASADAADLLAGTSFGKAALRKLGSVPDNFRLYRSEWLGKKPADWKEMRVTGRVFRASRSGRLDIPVPGTIRSVIVTREEMLAADA